MAGFLIRRQVENGLQDMLGENAVRIIQSLSKIAAKQGGGSIIENYQLLGKRVLIALGVAAVAAQGISFVLARRSEEQRMEKVARRVFEEELQKADAEA